MNIGNRGNFLKFEALISLKKGTQLLKYSRKGKPKFCPFRVSNDETTLIWYSRKEERSLKLSSVSRIIPGQRTAVFKRFPRPEKDYLSFALIYNNGERSLNLICRDKVEADAWFLGLKSLISTGRQSRRSRSSFSDFSDGGEFLQDVNIFGTTLKSTSNIPRSQSPVKLTSSDVGTDRANMHMRASTDGCRASVSSYSTQGSGPDDIESLGDVYVWGAIWGEGSSSDRPGNSHLSKSDVLIPKPLESNVVLDVHQIACGVRHAALVTRQGEVFTWGEESGGRLGHGIDKAFSRPQLVEFLAVNQVDYVACGEYHTCATSASGDLFMWGDGTHNAGLLGQHTDVSHWVPKRVTGPLEGLQVLSVACGTWHSALTTSGGRLFTFGDGTFGALGHGNRDSAPYPTEIESLRGLKIVKVACGVWHTAAVVEVEQPGANVPLKKLFTWGDGDKYRLGHGDKETRLVPTCVASLSEYDFQQVSCGHNITVALTTSGHVFTMGSTMYGQLGSPKSDGKLPCLVQDRLIGTFIEDVSCGAFHVAVLTSRSEVFTWGKGANGRLGHGDTEDRKTPKLVDALKDRLVKSICCGSNFTVTICIHKWVSGADQSLCSGCRQAFGFTRKRHNCYNCGLVHCHACSSKKALRAALAPTPGKPHRVCDPCYAKLKAEDDGTVYHSASKSVTPRKSIDNRERFDMQLSKVLLSPTLEPVKYLEVKSEKDGKPDSLSVIRASLVPSFLQLKDIGFPSRFSAFQDTPKPLTPSTQPVRNQPIPPCPPIPNSRPVSPYSRKPSPPRSPAHGFSKGVVDSLKKTNELLNQEVLKLQNQVKNLRLECEVQDVELQRSQKKAQDAASLAEENSCRFTEAKEIYEAITTELKDVTEIENNENIKVLHIKLETLFKTKENEEPSEASSSSLPADILESEEQNSSNTAVVTDLGQNAEGAEVPDSSSHEVAESQPNNSEFTRSPSVRNDGQQQIIEQFEPGVYVTLVQLQNGTKLFKRVRFSKRKFNGQQAADWWRENSSRVLRKYNNQVADGSSISAAPSSSTLDESESTT
ncbi:hypothetical protein ACHQM5_014093 [Ranunculus cassubicifolius]